MTEKSRYEEEQYRARSGDRLSVPGNLGIYWPTLKLPLSANVHGAKIQVSGGDLKIEVLCP
jgi:hypothetical protein